MSTVVNLETLSPSGFPLDGGRAHGYAGFSVDGAGDVNGDGFDDVVIGGLYTNAAVVIFGHAGGFPGIHLDNLSASSGFFIQGEGSDGMLGVSVSGAGDVNGDGFDDVIVGGAAGGFYYSGVSKAYVIFGHDGGFNTVNLATLGATDGFVISSNQFLNFNVLNVTDAGDVNGDGFGDIAVGSRDTGSAYVIFGHGGAFGPIDLTGLGTAGFQITGGTPGLTVRVEAAGDVNHDGFKDFIVSGQGRTYVLFGHAGAFGDINLANLPATAGFIIQGTGIASAAGDFNGDGFADIVLGLPSDGTGGQNAGAAYVVFGHGGAFANIDLSHLAPTDGFAIVGDSAGDQAGASVAAAGDVNHDGFADIIIGAPTADNGGVLGGESYVIYGHSGLSGTIDLTNLPTAAGFIMRTGTAGQGVGSSVAGAGDVNGDGFDDVIVGAPNADRTLPDAGAAFVVFSPAHHIGHAQHDFNGDGRSDVLWRNDSGTTIDLLGQVNGSFAGNVAATLNPGLDWHVAGTGDFNGDGLGDVLWRNDNGAVETSLGEGNGSFGSNPNFSLNPGLDWHVVGTGDFNGDGRDDILWRNDQGTLIDLLGASNGSFIGNLGSASNPGLTWHVEGTGDFNGDGRFDVLLRSATGAATTLLGKADGSFADNANFNLNPGLDWHVVGTGDFNGDGFDDLLWRNDAGTITDLLGMSNGAFVGNVVNLSLNPGVGWYVAETGDFNGDGFDDVLLRDGTGNTIDWLGQANGAFTDNSAVFHLNPGTDWHVQDPFVHDPFA